MRNFLVLGLLLLFVQNAYPQVIEQKYWTLRKNVTRVDAPSVALVPYPGGQAVDYLQATFYMVAGKFHYMSDNEHYMFYPGDVNFYNSRPNSIYDVATAPSLVLKRVNNTWVFWQEVPEVSPWSIRSNKVTKEWVALGDANEIGPNTPQNRWRGNAYFGKIGSKGSIAWTQINKKDQMDFFHGITGGDLNGDGLIDIGAAPSHFEKPSGVMTFLQNTDGSFRNEDTLVTFPKGYNAPFTLEYVDLNGDGRDEIITADYGHSPENQADKMNNVMVFSYNPSKGKFENTFVSKEPTAFYNTNLGATSIHAYDFTNDGIIDLAIAREGPGDGGASHTFEIWRGLGDGTFKAHWSTPIWSANQIQFREFSVFDVNDDGFLDIIFRPFHYGSFYRNNPVWWNVLANNGIKLHKLIWLNDGKGKFNHYDKDELKIEGINIDNVHPYMDGKNLHFVGTFTEPNGMLWGQKAILLTTFDIQVHLNGRNAPESPDLTFPTNQYQGLQGGTQFTWSASSNAKTYQIQISANNTFSSIYLQTDTLSQARFTIPSFKPGDPVQFYWRVRGNGIGGYGDWSTTHTFTRAALAHSELEVLPDKPVLYQNYPNPFNPSTEIRFYLPMATQVNIEIFNSLGQLVAKPLDAYKQAGTHHLPFDAGSLSSGIYFYRLNSPHYTETKRMSIIK